MTHRLEPEPLGVPLDQLEAGLRGTTLKASREGDTLVVRHEHFTTVVSVVPAANPEADSVPISAVVQIRTELPKAAALGLNSDSQLSIANCMATLGAVTREDGAVYVGSRLTVHSGDDPWPLYLPLLAVSVIASTDNILRAIRRTLMREPNRTRDASRWTKADFKHVHDQFSNRCFCNASATGFTAEFGLKKGAASAMAGHGDTALWSLHADAPHPEWGMGLLAILRMPQQISDRRTIGRLANELNGIEMQPHDLPPHFGAWCESRLHDGLAYVSFLPNDLHTVEGIALNLTTWAYHRAHLADAMLQTMKVR